MGSVHRTARVAVLLILAATTLVAAPRTGSAQGTVQPPQPVLQKLVVVGATVYTPDDVRWLLDLTEGAPLRRPATALADALRDRYKRDGYTEARVAGEFADGVLTLRVDEGRIDDIEFAGASDAEAHRLARRLEIKPGDAYNARAVSQAVGRMERASGGAFSHQDPRLEARGARRVLVIPIDWRRPRFTWSTDPDREDLYSPVDGFNPALGLTTTVFDRGRLNHTLIDAFVNYKFAREEVGYSAGLERPLFGSPKLFLGGELHDLTASDDLWRLTTAEQALAAVLLKKSFRDYYRRHGGQLFAVLQGGRHNELMLGTRWDRDSSLGNETDYSLFGGDAFRVNPPASDERINSWIIGYRFDTRPLSGAGERQTYLRHLADDLYGYGSRRIPGLRLEWTSELAQHGLGGDADFERHILNLRGYLSFSPRQLLAARTILGFSRGPLPPEREFAVGGIGTVHGYAFKEARGTGMALLNAEYAVDLTPPRGGQGALLSVFGFYDAGKATGSLASSRSDWLQGVGFGVTSGNWLRIDVGFRADAIPSSRQILVRLGPTF